MPLVPVLGLDTITFAGSLHIALGWTEKGKVQTGLQDRTWWAARCAYMCEPDINMPAQ